MKYWKRYKGFAKCAISAKINYRIALLMGIANSSVEIIASLFLWQALFAEQSMISGYTWSDMIVYILIAFVLNATLGYTTEKDIAEQVLNGSISMDLIKPINYQSRCLFQTMGSSLVEGIIAIVIASLAALVLCDIGGYLIPVRCLLLIVSLLMAFLIKFEISYIGGLCCFFTSNGYGVLYLRQVITDIFSGALLPISFYPLWFQKLAGVLPFQSIVYTPTQVFLGRLTQGETIHVLVLQLAWIVVLWIFGHFFFRFAIRKVTIQGG